MKENKKGAASIRRGAGLLLRTAWQSRRSVLLLCVVLAVLSAGQTTVQLLVAPVILDRVERAAPLPELLAAIGLFSAALFLLAALHAYTENVAQLPRTDLRTGKLLRRCNEKFACTSFPNLYDPSFLDLTNKAQDALMSNSSAAEETWVTLTALLTNLIGFLVYLALLSGLHPALLLLVVATTAAGFFVNRRIDGWSYRHREEGMKASHQIGYIQGLRTDRRAAKDIFLFGLQPWLLQVRRDGLRLFRDFQRKCAGRGLITDGTALLLDLLRNGVAYAYLLGLALGKGMSAAEFLLYFTAVSGFTQWVTGILDEVGKLHRESLELCSIQDYL